MNDQPTTPPPGSSGGDQPADSGVAGTQGNQTPAQTPAAQTPAAQTPAAQTPADPPQHSPAQGTPPPSAPAPGAQAPGAQGPFFSYPAPQGPPPQGPPPGEPTGAFPTPPFRRPRVSGMAAAVVATALVIGGAAGVGGAAAWSALDGVSGAPTIGTATTSQIVDTSSGPQSPVEAVASKVLPSVVMIDVAGPQEAGSGSGIIISSDGYIVTNNHVVAIAGAHGSITVSFNDGSTAKAQVVGTDPLTDIAVIKAEGVSNLSPATIGKSSDAKVGESVVAIGSPFGLDSTVTSGIVSALNRPVDVGSDGQGNTTTYPAIQTDAAINPGNSGGALVDLHGNVIGINSSIRTASSGEGQAGSIGLGFAIPVDYVMPIVQQILKGETPTHARLGISVSDVASRLGEPAPEGAQIQSVTPGSSAANAGLSVGDIITKVDGQIISGADSLVATIRSYRPGDKVTISYQQKGQTKSTTVTLESDANTSNS